MKISKYGLICMALLMGCTPEVARWTPAESPKENVVDRAVFTHTVHYPSHESKMSEREKANLKHFLERTVLRPSGVTVILDQYGTLSKERLKDLQRELLRFGIPYELITISEDFEGVEGSSQCDSRPQKKYKGSIIDVTVERYVVIPPSCADFSNPNEWKQDLSASNYACADETNLGMMVANPRDLLKGRTLGDSSGKVMADGVTRYLTDKVKPLLESGTTGETSNTEQPESFTGASSGTSVGAY